MEGFDRNELQDIRMRAVELASAMALAAGHFDAGAKAFVGLANAADRCDQWMAKQEGEEDQKDS